MFLIVHTCSWWVGVLIGVVGVLRARFLAASLAASQNALRASTVPLSSTPGRTRTCDLLIRSQTRSSTGGDTEGHRDTKLRFYGDLGLYKRHRGIGRDTQLRSDCGQMSELSCLLSHRGGPERTPRF